MAAAKTQTSTNVLPQYHVFTPAGEHVVAQQLVGSSMLRLGTAGSYLDLSVGNVTDLLSVLTAFANTGAIPQ